MQIGTEYSKGLNGLIKSSNKMKSELVTSEETEILNRKILHLHQSERYPELAALYVQWGKNQLKAGKVNEGCFFLTQSYIIALEFGMSIAEEVFIILKGYGREE